MTTMKLDKTYAIGFVLLFMGISAGKAQIRNHEKNLYRMEHIKTSNPWLESFNGSGLIFNEYSDFTIVEIGFRYGEGKFRNINAPEISNKTTVKTESFRKLNKVFLYGRFDFDYMNRKEMGWCNVINPYRSPIFFADSMPGTQTLETYNIKGGIGYAIGRHWTIGAKTDYLSASNAKKKDARNKNTYMNFNLYPGIMYGLPNLNAGLNFIYRKETENIEINTMGSDRTPELLNVEGLWFYTSEQVNETKAIKRDIEDETFGGAAQLEISNSRIRLFNQFSILEKKEEIFKANYNKERGGEMKERKYNYIARFDIKGRNFRHHINLTTDFSNMLGYENIQQNEIDNQNSKWIQYGKKNKSAIESRIFDMNYRLFRDRHSYWEAQIGAKNTHTERTYRLYPAKFRQTLKNFETYISFTKNFLFEKSMLDCNLKGTYTKGNGNLLDMETETDTSLPDIENYKQRKDVLEAEFEYLTSDFFKGGIKIRYTYFLNKTEGINLYAIGGFHYKKSLSGMYDGRHRTGLETTIGISF